MPRARKPLSPAPAPDPSAAVIARVEDAPRAAPPPAALVALRHPRSWPLAFGDYRTGGVIHQVDPATAERLLARGFERVSDADPDAATDATLPPADATPPANPAITLFPADPASED